MELLKNKILNEGGAKGTDIIQVGAFLNHQLDINLLNEIGKEFAERFKDIEKIDIITITIFYKNACIRVECDSVIS